MVGRFVKFAGLTGSIGCGKSTVAAGLVKRGAVSVDVDQLSRTLQQPGEPVFVAMVERWGDRVVRPDGTLDRATVAAITFGNRDEMGALMAMTSSAIETAQEAAIKPLEDTDAVVLLESALLGRLMYGTSGLVVVDVSEDVAIDRLVQRRGMTEADVDLAWPTSRQGINASARLTSSSTMLLTIFRTWIRSSTQPWSGSGPFRIHVTAPISSPADATAVRPRGESRPPDEHIDPVISYRWPRRVRDGRRDTSESIPPGSAREWRVGCQG